MRGFIVGLVLVLACLAPAWALNPPWYYQEAKVKALLEGPGISVLELTSVDSHWLVTVQVGGEGAAARAQALATVLRRGLLNDTVIVKVVTADGKEAQALTLDSPTPEKAIEVLNAALQGNPHYSGAFKTDMGVLIEAEPQFVQFYADNISDRHGLAHIPAAEAWKDLLDLSRFGGIPFLFSYDAK